MFKRLKITALALLVGLCTATGYYSKNIPDSFYVEKGENLEISPILSVSTSGTAQADVQTYSSSQSVMLKLFGIIPIKSVEVCRMEAPTLTVGGIPFGIKLLMDGVMVVKLNDGDCPAKDAGIETGDIIKSIDNISVSSNSEVQEIIGKSGGNKLKIVLIRDKEEMTVYLNPIWNDEKGCYIGGMWVRDSTAGIGTLTFVDKSTGAFGGLGHPICDADTGEIIPVSSGKAVPVEITETVKGKNGIPGELNGCFTSNECIGTLELNNKCGIFGTLTQEACESISGDEYKMAFKQDIKKGTAYILCTTDGSIPEKYEIEIESINYSESSTKNMVIKITDENLIEKTGGIVQGMSGSPIIQDDKIIGAVTHVFISDPKRGYAIFAENMVEYINRAL